jgi:hypothetical protein
MAYRESTISTRRPEKVADSRQSHGTERWRRVAATIRDLFRLAAWTIGVLVRDPRDRSELRLTPVPVGHDRDHLVQRRPGGYRTGADPWDTSTRRHTDLSELLRKGPSCG